MFGILHFCLRHRCPLADACPRQRGPQRRKSDIATTFAKQGGASTRATSRTVEKDCDATPICRRPTSCSRVGRTRSSGHSLGRRGEPPRRHRLAARQILGPRLDDAVGTGHGHRNRSRSPTDRHADPARRSISTAATLADAHTDGAYRPPIPGAAHHSPSLRCAYEAAYARHNADAKMRSRFVRTSAAPSPSLTGPTGSVR
jgi:hypothetical protein